MRTARSRTSGENLFDLVIAPSSQVLEPPQNPGRFITYEHGFTGRAHIDEAFAREGLTPQVVLTTMDADVIKTYVELGMGMGMGMGTGMGMGMGMGMGIGIVASIAFDPERDRLLCAVDARHLFEINLTRIALRRGIWLRDYAYHFIESFVPTLTPSVVRQRLDENN